LRLHYEIFCANWARNCVLTAAASHPFHLPSLYTSLSLRLVTIPFRIREGGREVADAVTLEPSCPPSEVRLLAAQLAADHGFPPPAAAAAAVIPSSSSPASSSAPLPLSPAAAQIYKAIEKALAPHRPSTPTAAAAAAAGAAGTGQDAGASPVPPLPDPLIPVQVRYINTTFSLFIFYIFPCIASSSINVLPFLKRNI
jgi:hypothetical protein